jgi:hypothetical protein
VSVVAMRKTEFFGIASASVIAVSVMPSGML